MLIFDPWKRINTAESLSHTYVAPYHDPTDKPIVLEEFNWCFNDANLPVDNWKVMMCCEILGMLHPMFHFTVGLSLKILDRLPPGHWPSHLNL